VELGLGVPARVAVSVHAVCLRSLLPLLVREAATQCLAQTVVNTLYINNL
jgi:hypothetical protein